MRQAADRPERSVADGLIESQVKSDAFAAWLRSRSCTQYNCRPQLPDAVAHGGNDMAKAAKATKKAADQVEQAPVGDAELAALGAADDVQSPTAEIDVANSAVDPDDLKPLKPYLDEWTPPEVPDGSDVTAVWLKKIDDNGKDGARIAYHVGLRLVAERQAAIDAANGLTRGVAGKWLKRRAKSLGRVDRTLSLYMNIARAVSEVKETALQTSVLNGALRDVLTAIRVAGGKIARTKKKPDPVTSWTNRATHLIARAEPDQIPIEALAAHYDELSEMISRQCKAFQRDKPLVDVVIPPAWRVPNGQFVIKYPGGKMQHSGHIVALLRRMAIAMGGASNKLRFVEPFVGGGSIVNTVVRTCSDLFSSFQISDRNQSTASVYNMIFDHMDEIKERLMSLDLTHGEWMRLAMMFNDQEGDYQQLELAIATIVPFETGRMNYGPAAGSPPTNFLDDWHPESTCARLEAYRDDLVKFWRDGGNRWEPECRTSDAIDVVREATETDVMYLDPPYMLAGLQLYTLGFTMKDHVRLRDALNETKAMWLLSYDDHPIVRELYKDHTVRTFPNPGGNGETELLIWPCWFDPDDANSEPLVQLISTSTRAET